MFSGNIWGIRSLITGFFCGLVFLSQVGPLTSQITAQQAESSAATRYQPAGLMFNLDCAHFFTVNDPEQVGGEHIDEMIDFHASAGVKEFVCNVTGQRASYASDVWERMWEGYDPDGPDDQPYLRGTLPEDIASYREMLDTFVAIHRRGVDYPARVIDRCRAQGMRAWLSVRMNDHHGLESETNPTVSRILRENAQLSRVPYQLFVRADRAFDFAHDEVRDRCRLLIDELLTRYDMDGLELDFCRHPLFFGIGRELAGSKLMTDWVGEVHNMIEAAQKRRGHPVYLSVRVPSEPETCRNVGLDVMEWVRSGWIDLVTVNASAVATSTDFNMPIRLWRDLLRPYGVSLAGCSEASIASCHPAAMHGIQGKNISPAMLRGAAAAFLYGGADAVYVFNMFREVLHDNPDWGDDESIREAFIPLNSLEALEPLHRRHIVTYREITAPGELLARPKTIRTGELSFIDAALPAEGKYGIFRLQTGPKPAGRKVQAVLEFRNSRRCAISIRVNGVPCPLASREEEGDVLRFDVPESALADEAHVIEVYANLAGGPPFTLVWVEMDIAAAN